MATAMFPKAKEAFLSGSIDLTTATIKVALVNITSDYTYSSATQYLSGVTTYSGTSGVTLTSPSVTSGVFNASSPVTFTSVAISNSKTVGALVIYKDTGSAATSPVILYIDGFTAITPNGGNITITWDTGANKIFALN